MNVESWTSFNHVGTPRVLVRRAGFRDQVLVQLRRRFDVDLLQELQPFVVSIPLLATTDDLPIERAQGREQRRCASLLVVMRDRTVAAFFLSSRPICVRSKACI